MKNTTSSMNSVLDPLGAINMLLFVLLLYFPLLSFAAPAAGPVTVVLPSRAISPHKSCYSSGLQLTDMGNWNVVNATVLAGCEQFASYNGHTFSVGDSVSWCADVSGGKGSRINFSMQYKGNDSTWTAESSNYQDGLTQYCWAAMEWALTECLQGGVFENHKLGSDTGSVGWQYWTVKLDPNSGGC